jgi:hypothetical protein
MYSIWEVERSIANSSMTSETNQGIVTGMYRNETDSRMNAAIRNEAP